jgi:hypothetical protein
MFEIPENTPAKIKAKAEKLLASVAAKSGARQTLIAEVQDLAKRDVLKMTPAELIAAPETIAAARNQLITLIYQEIELRQALQELGADLLDAAQQADAAANADIETTRKELVRKLCEVGRYDDWDESGQMSPIGIIPMFWQRSPVYRDAEARANDTAGVIRLVKTSLAMNLGEVDQLRAALLSFRDEQTGSLA